jgi:hypothetical protein
VALAARLAGGGVLEIATARKPDCYRFCVHHSLSGVPLSPWGQPEVTRVAIALGRSPTNGLTRRIRQQAAPKTRTGSPLSSMKHWQHMLRQFGNHLIHIPLTAPQIQPDVLNAQLTQSL